MLSMAEEKSGDSPLKEVTQIPNKINNNHIKVKATVHNHTINGDIITQVSHVSWEHLKWSGNGHLEVDWGGQQSGGDSYRMTKNRRNHSLPTLNII